MGKFIDLTGQRFGRLVVIRQAKNKGSRTAWLCKCNCGKEKIIVSSSLIAGLTKSCGCYFKEIHKKVFTKHNMSHTKPHNIWTNMLRRCNDPQNEYYAYYGGKGVRVCDRWLEFNNFWEDMKDGYCEGLTLDRIDYNGNYEKSNCRWATMKEQSNNRSSNILIEYNNEIHTIAEWAEITKLSWICISKRLKRGWSVEKTLTTPKLRST